MVEACLYEAHKWLVVAEAVWEVRDELYDRDTQAFWKTDVL